MRALNDLNDVLRVAYCWLAQTQLTESQLRQRLALAIGDKPIRNNLVSKTMQVLKKENLIQDEWLAEKIAKRYSHLSNSMIFTKLMAKGLSPKLASETIDQLIPESIRAQRLAQQKWCDLACEAIEIRKGIVTRYLESRGFNDALLTQALDSLLH